MLNRHNAALALIVAIWGLYYLGTDLLLRSGWDPFWMNALRFLIGGLVLLAITVQTRGGEPLRDLHSSRNLPRVLLVAFGCVCLGMWLLTWSQEILPSSTVGVLAASTPLWAAALGLLAYFGGYYLRPLGWLGLLIGFAGILIVYAPWSAESLPLQGVALALAATLLLALEGQLFARWFRDVLPAAAAICFWTGIGFLAVALFQDFQSGSWLLLVVMALSSNSLAYLIYFWLVVQRGATFANLYSYLAPVVALFSGALVVGDPVGIFLFLGCLLAISGAVLGARNTGRLPSPKE